MDEVNFGMNQYCGPSVLSIFTGHNTDVCAEEISKVNSKTIIKGVTPADLIKAGNAMGLDFLENEAYCGRSIYWAASVMTKMPPAMYLVTIPKHYVALEVRDNTIYICDNHTKTEIELQNSARLSQRIERVWKVTKVREYSRPHVVKEEFHAERYGDNIQIKIVMQMSDGGIKIIPIGDCKIKKTSDIQEIAFELMKLTGKDI